jgi:hypothetical protein
VIEDVCRAVEVVETLGGEHHSHVFAAVEQGHGSQKEILPRDLLHILAVSIRAVQPRGEVMLG